MQIGGASDSHLVLHLRWLNEFTKVHSCDFGSSCSLEKMLHVRFAFLHAILAEPVPELDTDFEKFFLRYISKLNHEV